MDPMTPGADAPMGEEKKEEGQDVAAEVTPEAAPEAPAAE